MMEAVYFPEEKIPQVVAVIRRGLKAETDVEVKEQLENQCVELEEYFNDRLTTE